MLAGYRPLLIWQDPEKGEVILEFSTEEEALRFSKEPDLDSELLRCKDNELRQVRIVYYQDDWLS